jgi:drug/metabolite transporter (DMT)-like permease
MGAAGARAILLALASAVLFGASIPASKALLGALPAFPLAGLLYLGAAFGTAPFALRERRAQGGLRLDRANALRLAGAIALGGVAGPLLLLAALQQTLAGSVSLLLVLEGVFTAVLGVLVFREHLGRGAWAGVAGATAASALLAGGAGWPGLAGALLAAAACACWAVDNHLTALVDGIGPARATFAKGAVAGVVNLAIGLAASPFAVGSATVAAALAVGALSYGASIVLYVRAAHELGAVRAQALFGTAPFAGAALAFAALGEPLGLVHAAAAALLVPSLFALLHGRHGHAHVHAALDHVHDHRHDDGHHLHEHPGSPASLRHSHPHRHEPLAHAHPHWPDLHHRHEH